MKKETVLFFENLMRRDGSILDLIDGSYTFLNDSRRIMEFQAFTERNSGRLT